MPSILPIATFLAVSIMHMFNEIVQQRIWPITHYQKQKYQFRPFVLPAFTSWAMILLPLSITTNQPPTPHKALLPLCSPALPLFSKGIHRKWISINASFNSLDHNFSTIFYHKVISFEALKQMSGISSKTKSKKNIYALPQNRFGNYLLISNVVTAQRVFPGRR